MSYMDNDRYMDNPSRQLRDIDAPRIPSLELAMGLQFNECSIAASEACRRATDLMDDPDLYTGTKTIYSSDQDQERPLLQNVSYIPLSDEVLLHDGRPVALGLLRASGQKVIDLVAVARSSTAFPIATFGRRAGSACDYVQIGEERFGKDLIVTTDDEHSRKEVIEAIRLVLDANPNSQIYKDAFLPLDKEAAQKLVETIRNARDRMRMIRPDLSKKYVNQRAIFKYASGKSVLEGVSAHMGSASEPNDWRSKRNDKRTTEKLTSLQSVPLSSITEGKFPGSEDPITRHILLRLALEERGITTATTRTVSRNTEVLLDIAGMDKKIEEKFGPYDSRLEKAITFTGQLAAAGSVKRIVLEDFLFSNTRGDAEITLTAEPNRTAGVFILKVTARPAALDDALTAGVDYHVDSLGPNMMSKDQTQEVADLATLVARSEARSKARAQHVK